MTPEQFFKERAPTTFDLAMSACELLRSVAPEAVEWVSPGRNGVFYGTSANSMKAAICYIAAFKAHVNIGFLRGTSLSDPEQLMEGTGENLRHIKIRRVEDLQKPALRQLLVAAFAG
jgi:hypothetical protein